jgi:hypothetical protein
MGVYCAGPCGEAEPEEMEQRNAPPVIHQLEEPRVQGQVHLGSPEESEQRW